MSIILLEELKQNPVKIVSSLFMTAYCPFFKKHYSPNSKYLLLNTMGNRKQYAALNAKPWKTAMISMGMEHTLHDTRHTCATVMKKYDIDDYYRKLILGHSLQNLTDRVYTKTTIKRLVTEINKIPVPQVST